MPDSSNLTQLVEADLAKLGNMSCHGQFRVQENAKIPGGLVGDQCLREVGKRGQILLTSRSGSRITILIARKARKYIFYHQRWCPRFRIVDIGLDRWRCHTFGGPSKVYASA